MQSEYFTISNCVFNVNFIALVLSMILGGGSQNYIRGTSSLDAPSRKNFYTQNEYFGISNCIFNSNLLALVVSKILGRSQIYTIGEPTHP